MDKFLFSIICVLLGPPLICASIRSIQGSNGISEYLITIVVKLVSGIFQLEMIALIPGAIGRMIMDIEPITDFVRACAYVVLFALPTVISFYICHRCWKDHDDFFDPVQLLVQTISFSLGGILAICFY